MNHRSRFDWLFYWGLVDKLANHRYTKIVLKSGLRNLPGIGMSPLQRTRAVYLRVSFYIARLFDADVWLHIFEEELGSRQSLC